MALSVVHEDQDEFEPETERQRDFAPEASYRMSQGARGAGPHAPQFDRVQTSPRPAAAWFPTEQVIAVLAAIGAVLGARVALLVALGMMFALGMAGDRGAPYRMALMGVFGVIPVALLSARRSL